MSESPTPHATLNPTAYALGMAGATVLAVLGAAGAASLAGPGTGLTGVDGAPVRASDGGSRLLGGLTAGIVAVAAVSLVPIMAARLVPASQWGMSVLLSSGARTILALGVLLLLVQAGLPKQPTTFGMLTGAMILIVAEAALAVWLINRRSVTQAGAVASLGRHSTDPAQPMTHGAELHASPAQRNA
jgi:hypothetical protein